MTAAKTPIATAAHLPRHSATEQLMGSEVENPSTTVVLGMIRRLREPDRAQWFRLVLGLITTATEADRAHLLAIEEEREPRLLASFGSGPADAVSEVRPWVDQITRQPDAIFVPAKAGQASVIGVPILRAQRVRGVLLLESRHASFRVGDLTLARAVARTLNDAVVEDVAATTAASGRANADSLRQPFAYGKLLARSNRMLEIFELIDRIAATDHPVIIEGESGTGKELVARAIHFHGRRRSQPFIAENCAALSDSLLEAELFGYVKGAFTGADRDRQGFFELADGGALFLDEIGEMNEKMQTDLLRVLQEGEVRPVGGKRIRRVDVRIICASNRNLAEMVANGSFRKDLYYRLNVMTVELPPLRERREDIPLLVEHFLDAIAHDTSTAPRSLGAGVLEALYAYDWPGNIRELKNELKRMVALSRNDRITLADLRLAPSRRLTATPAAPLQFRPGGEFWPLALVERRHIEEALRRTNGNKAAAAQLLGVNKATIFRKLKSYFEEDRVKSTAPLNAVAGAR